MRKKNIKYNKKNINPKISSKIQYKNELKTSFNGFQTTKNENHKNRIKSAMIDDSDKKKVKKEKNDSNFKDIKKRANFEMINNSRMKSKKNIKSKSIYLEENKDKDKDHISKFNSCKTPTKNLHNNKLNLKSKIVKPLDKKKTHELSERADKKQNLYNKTGGFQKSYKEIISSEDLKKEEQKIKMNIIYEKKESKDKNEDQPKLIPFHTNTNSNISQDTFNKISENPKKNQIKHFSSYTGKKTNNKLVKNIDNYNEKLIHNKFILFKQKALPILENEDNIIINKESYSKIDEDSVIASNKKMNCYEPFDLNFAYIKPRKELKEEVLNLLEKHKMKYRSLSKTRFMIEFKKEDVILCVKFDKLKIINDDQDKNNDNNNNIRISILKIKRLKGNYQSDIKAFEKLLYKLN